MSAPFVMGANIPENGVVWAAGIVPLVSIDGVEWTLLLRDSTHNQWFSPKGEIEQSESLFCCALRELFEETSIRISMECIVSSPYWISYKLPSGEIKRTALFVVELGDCFPEINISAEHNTFQWVPLGYASTLATTIEASKLFEEMVADRSAKIIADKELQCARYDVLEAASRAVTQLPTLEIVDWYLAGSWSSLEATISAGRLLSDIDLVARTTTHLASAAQESAWQAVMGELKSVSADLAVAGCGIYFLNPTELPVARNTFWSYFSRSALHIGYEELGASDTNFVGSIVEYPDPYEEAYALLWYRLSRSPSNDDHLASYGYAKSLALAPLLLDPIFCNFEFSSYASYKRELVSRLATVNQENESVLLLALWALDWKLNCRHAASLQESKAAFCYALDYYVTQRIAVNSTVRPLISSLLEHVQENRQISFSAIESIQKLAFFRLPEICRLQCEGEITAEISMLIFMAARLILWGHRLKSSLFKYKRQATELLLLLQSKFPQPVISEINALLDRAFSVAHASFVESRGNREGQV